MHLIYALLVIVLSLSACSDNSTQESILAPSQINVVNAPSIDNTAIPDNRFSNNYQVLMFGNSHVSGLKDLIQTLISVGNPYAEISVVNGGGGFLDNMTQNRINLLNDKSWTHIILQGQKYSQSGSTIYSTTAAQIWIDKAKKFGITPILFPEHPQRGNTEEGKRVHNIHLGISAIQKSCIAPVGLAWDKVIITAPQLALHNNDGNHAAYLGRLLTAFVFYEVITGEAADLLPFIEEIKVAEPIQQLLKQLASETIQANQPCMFKQQSTLTASY